MVQRPASSAQSSMRRSHGGAMDAFPAPDAFPTPDACPAPPPFAYDGDDPLTQIGAAAAQAQLRASASQRKLAAPRSGGVAASHSSAVSLARASADAALRALLASVDGEDASNLGARFYDAVRDRAVGAFATDATASFATNVSASFQSTATLPPPQLRASSYHPQSRAVDRPPTAPADRRSLDRPPADQPLDRPLDRPPPDRSPPDRPPPDRPPPDRPDHGRSDWPDDGERPADSRPPTNPLRPPSRADEKAAFVALEKEDALGRPFVEQPRQRLSSGGQASPRFAAASPEADAGLLGSSWRLDDAEMRQLADNVGRNSMASNGRASIEAVEASQRASVRSQSGAPRPQRSAESGGGPPSRDRSAATAPARKNDAAGPAQRSAADAAAEADDAFGSSWQLEASLGGARRREQQSEAPFEDDVLLGSSWRLPTRGATPLGLPRSSGQMHDAAVRIAPPSTRGSRDAFDRDAPGRDERRDSLGRESLRDSALFGDDAARASPPAQARRASDAAAPQQNRPDAAAHDAPRTASSRRAVEDDASSPYDAPRTASSRRDVEDVRASSHYDAPRTGSSRRDVEAEDAPRTSSRCDVDDDFRASSHEAPRTARRAIEVHDDARASSHYDAPRTASRRVEFDDALRNDAPRTASRRAVEVEDRASSHYDAPRTASSRGNVEFDDDVASSHDALRSASRRALDADDAGTYARSAPRSAASSRQRRRSDDDDDDDVGQRLSFASSARVLLRAADEARELHDGPCRESVEQPRDDDDDDAYSDGGDDGAREDLVQTSPLGASEDFSAAYPAPASTKPPPRRVQPSGWAMTFDFGGGGPGPGRGPGDADAPAPATVDAHESDAARADAARADAARAARLEAVREKRFRDMDERRLLERAQHAAQRAETVDDVFGARQPPAAQPPAAQAPQRKSDAFREDRAAPAAKPRAAPAAAARRASDGPPRAAKRISNKRSIANALAQVCLAGPHCAAALAGALAALEQSGADTHVVVLKDDAVHTFRGLYA
ncbi:hypothetical protein M885DRAFT_255422 [Pelagophyceae sp. CCMP2097]|nr:hypothetical protein M885DRAFT_255422 [Pelagophyceae sp. CCMP2097]